MRMLRRTSLPSARWPRRTTRIPSYSPAPQRGRQHDVGAAVGVGAERAGGGGPHRRVAQDLVDGVVVLRQALDPQVHRVPLSLLSRFAWALAPGAADVAELDAVRALGLAAAAARRCRRQPRRPPRRRRRRPRAQRGRSQRRRRPMRRRGIGRVLARIGVEQALLERRRQRLVDRRFGAAGQRQQAGQRRQRVALGGALRAVQQMRGARPPPRRGRARRARRRRASMAHVVAAASRHHAHLLEHQPQRAQRVPGAALDGADRQLARSAISRTVRPWKCARRIICRCSGVRRSSAAATCQPSIACSIESRLLAVSISGSRRRERRPHGRAPADVDDRVAGDLVEPRAHAAARRVVGLGVAPGAREDLLHDLLGRAALAERVEREAEQLAGVGAVERAQRLAGLVGAQALDQLGVASARSSGIRSDWRRVRARSTRAGTRLVERAWRPAQRSPATNSVGVRRHAGAHAAAEAARARARRPRSRAPVGVEALDVEPEPLGARPQVRILEPALVGEQRVVHRPERALQRRPPRPRRRRRARAGGSSAPGSAGTRRAARGACSRTSRAAQNGHS